MAISKPRPETGGGDRVKIVVPFANQGSIQLEAVKLNLKAQGVSAEFVELLKPLDYSGLLIKLWTDPFIIVEHDIIPWPGALTELSKCDQPWCGFPYRLSDQLPPRGQMPRVEAWLGCTKIGRAHV